MKLIEKLYKKSMLSSTAIVLRSPESKKMAKNICLTVGLCTYVCVYVVEILLLDLLFGFMFVVVG